MSKFLKLVKEAIPTGGIPTGGGIPPGGAAKQPPVKPGAKKGSFMQKLASGAQKFVDTARKIEEIGTGKWEIDTVLQNILSKELDKSTEKIGLFGKKNYNLVSLGQDIVDKLNAYISSPTNESYISTRLEKLKFNKLINEAMSVNPRGDDNRFQSTDAVSVERKVYDLLVSKGIDLPDFRTSKPLLRYITKNVSNFVKTFKEAYPNVEFEYEKHEVKDELAHVDVAEQDDEIADQAAAGDIPKADWVRSWGEDKAYEIIRGIADIFPGDTFIFPESKDDEAGGEEGAGGEEKKILTPEDCIFEVTNPVNYGAKGTQYTLKPRDNNVAKILQDSNIKYITYINESPTNKFKLPETNTGTLYVYGNNNDIIKSLTTESARFKWNGQLKLYNISTQNDQIIGVSYSKGEFMINKSDVIRTDNQTVTIKDNKGKEVNLPIKKYYPTSQKYLIDISNVQNI